MALRLFGGIVFGVFGEVAFVASLGNGCGCGGTLYGDEMTEFVFEFLKSFFAVLINFGHVVNVF